VTSTRSVVVGAGGLRIAQRHAPNDVAVGDLRVGPLAPVALPEGPALEAQSSDGTVWRRHWEDGLRLIIDFVDVARAEVDGAGLVTFDRAIPAEVEEHLLLDHVLPLVLAQRGALVVHGGVISWRGTGAVLLGSSGHGKSTLTAFAWQRGWMVGGDDGAVLASGRPPTAEPTYPTVRLTTDSAALLGIDVDTGSPVAGKIRLADDRVRPLCATPVPVGVIAIVTPGDAGDTARFDPVAGAEAHAELFGSTFHADLRTRRLLPQIVDDLGQIIDSTLVGRLVVPWGWAGLHEAETVLRATLERVTVRSAAGP